VAADVVGFTRLSERLAGAGRRGAELLSDGIDNCFTALIECVSPLGGDVLFFGGDALFVAFEGSGHEIRAVESAMDMQRALRRFGRIATPHGTVRLSMSVGVATGTAQVVVGDGPQRPLFLVGPTVTRTVELEARSSAGQVLVAPRTARHLSDDARRDVDGASLVTRRPRRTGGDVDGNSWPGSGIRDRARSAQRAAMHVPDALRDRLVAGDAPREHRRIVVAFCRVRGLDRLAFAERAARLQLASAVIGSACREFDVCWVSTDVNADGARMILAAGLPHQSDDDELRLVAAAHRIQRSSLGRQLAVGVHRGTVFVGDIGHPTRRTYTVMGDTVNTAARLMVAAHRGELLASTDVVGHLGGRHRLGSERMLKVKGKRTAVAARTIGAAQTSGARTATVAIVGRSLELAVLSRALADHLSGVGGAIDVVAPAGMGKSRLIEAFLAAAPRPAMRISGELALSVAPFAVVVSPLRQLLGLRPDTPVLPAALSAVVGSLTALVAPVLGIDVAMTPESRAIEPRSVPQYRTDLITRLIIAAHPPPSLLLVEDVHWLDPSSAELLGGLIDRLAEHGWLAISTRRADSAALTTRGAKLSLEPLDEVEVRRLAIATSSGRGVDLSDATLATVVERAHGNALFLEQLVAAAASGSDVELPESAERVVGARLDRLPAAARRRLRQASVLGIDVDLDLLCAITGDADVGSEATWAGLGDFVAVGPGRVRFRNDLFRLSAYEGLTFAERTSLHAAAASHLEQGTDTPASVLARHFERAGRPDCATEWAALAAREATAHAAFSNAVHLWRLAADSARAAHLPDSVRVEILVELGRAHELLAEQSAAERAYQAALTLAPAANRPAIRARLAWVAFRSDRTSLAKRRVTTALRALDADGPGRRGAVTRVELTLLRSAIRESEGDLSRSDRDARWADTEARRMRRTDLRGQAVMQLALNADMSGDPAVGRLAATARRLLERSAQHHEVGILDLNLGLTLMVKGQWPLALALFESAAHAFTRCGGVLGGISTDANRGGILVEQGRLEEAIALYADVARRSRAAGHPRLVHFAEGSAARARGWLGDVDSAITSLTSGATALEGHPECGYLRWYLVEALILAERFDEARALIPALIREFAAHTRDQAVEVSLLRLDAIAAHLSGDPDALDGIRDAVELARQRRAPYDVVRGLHALELLDTRPDPAWTAERGRLCRDLGVTWLPPITLAQVSSTRARRSSS
jgi:class 3 adenylate cyclase/tetratricopeptide (TPR) repeat protein